MSEKLVLSIISVLLALYATTVYAKSFAVNAQLCQYGACPTFGANYCVSEVKPAYAVITGGVAIEGLKPVAAKQRLSETIKKIENYLAGVNKEAKLVKLGTLRTAKNPAPSFDFSQYSLAEKLEILMPLDSEIDAVLEKLPELGFNRMGTAWQRGYNDNNYKSVVFYRAKNLRDAIENAGKTCKKQAWDQFCMQNSYGVNAFYCGKKFEEIEKNIKTIYSYISGPSIVDDYGNNNNFYVNYPAETSKLDSANFVSSEVIKLTSNNTYQLVPEFPNADVEE